MPSAFLCWCFFCNSANRKGAVFSMDVCTFAASMFCNSFNVESRLILFNALACATHEHSVKLPKHSGRE